jgi:hypothetical protein
MSGNKIHGQLIVSITDAPSLNFHIQGCETCIITALSVLYNQNETFRNMMRKAALMNSEKALYQIHQRHEN